MVKVQVYWKQAAWRVKSVVEYSRQQKFCHLLKNYIEFYNHYLRCIKEQYVIISENVPTSFTVIDA